MAISTYVYSFMEREFISSNYYDLSFNLNIPYNSTSAFVFGHDPNLNTFDGLFLFKDKIELYKDDELVDAIYNIDNPSGKMDIVRQGTVITIFSNDVQIYTTEELSWNTVGAYNPSNSLYGVLSAENFVLKPYIVTEITPSTADYDGTVFGSNIHLEIDDNKLNMIDYGMLPQGAIGGGKVILNDVPLGSANKYAIQLEMKYNNTRFERLNNLTGQMQMRVYEDIMSSDTVKVYEKTLCSPMPVPNSKTMFTRHTDEGTLYFVQDPLNANSSFLTNAYNQYKGGVEITASDSNISLFNLDNAFSPVTVGNELVRAEFHRRSGFIRISRYDESDGDWATVNTFKLRNYPQLSLNDYNDDYAEVQFGNTVWKFYRGRPFIVLNHSQDDLRIMNLVDRVYCETVENQRGMGFIEEHDANCSVFNPQLSIQQFKQELHIGENIRLDNFELYEAIGGSNKTFLFVDGGTTASHNDNWSNPQYMTRDDGGTTISNTGTGTVFEAVRLNNSNIPFVNEDFTVEFEIVENPSSTNRFRFDGQTICTGETYAQWDYTFSNNETGRFKFVYDSTNNTIARYKDGTYINTITHHFCGKMGFLFRLESGASIKYKDFKVYQTDYNIGEVATNSQMGITQIDNENALVIVKEDNPLALNFPSYSSYVERVNDTFTLSIDYLDCPFDSIRIKARGFDEKGAVPVKDNIQYGIWEQTVDVEVDTTATDSVRATFTGCPSEVKYLDFVIFFTGANSTDIILKDLMYYDGDAIINHDIDTSRLFAEQVTINFADTYFANIYNDKDNCGLCIARPYQEPFTLTSLNASSETVLIPYLKNATEWDKPSQVFLEYLNAKQQVIDIDWEN